MTAPTHIIEKIEKIRKKAEERRAGTPSVPARAPVPIAVQLPLWPEHLRAVPNGFLRSALFGALKKGHRPYLEGELIAALDGIEVRYTGQRLDQIDLDIWESVLHAVRLQPFGGRCRTTTYALLKLMGRTDTGKNREMLRKRITRLVASALELRQGPYTYIGSLLRFAAKDERTQEWVLELDENLAPLFVADQYSLIEWERRAALRGQPISQWLHGFYASHAQPYPIKVETLHRLCGSEASQLFHFRAELREALAALASVTGWAWRIDEEDLVHIEKSPSPSQARHLMRKRVGGRGKGKGAA